MQEFYCFLVHQAIFGRQLFRAKKKGVSELCDPEEKFDGRVIIDFFMINLEMSRSRKPPCIRVCEN